MADFYARFFRGQRTAHQEPIQREDDLSVDSGDRKAETVSSRQRILVLQHTPVPPQQTSEELGSFRRRVKDPPPLEIKLIEFPNHVRELLTGKVKAKWKDLTGDMPRIGFVRELIRYESKEIISALTGIIKELQRENKK